jgi:hypothetical protein
VDDSPLFAIPADDTSDGGRLRPPAQVVLDILQFLLSIVFIYESPRAVARHRIILFNQPTPSMPRNSFFKEFRERHRSLACREGRHGECDGEVIVGDPTAWPVKRKNCSCDCHLTPIERLRKERPRKEQRFTRE